MFPWRDALLNVKAQTLVRWHRQGFQLFWALEVQTDGTTTLPKDLRRLFGRNGCGARNALLTN